MALPSFPTQLHEYTALLAKDYFLAHSTVDTVLVVNSCARAQAVPESDLDLAVLVRPEINAVALKELQDSWEAYARAQPTILKYRQSGRFAHLHLDIIDGDYKPMNMDNGEPMDNFEIEIGNQICYSAPMHDAGPYFQSLQKKWLPYYAEELRTQRLHMVIDACRYDLDHIPLLVRRELYFHSFDVLYKAFQKFLQAIFIANKIYPIAYNKWIKQQVAVWLKRPDVYEMLLPILSIRNIESHEIIESAGKLRGLLDRLEKMRL